MKIGYACMNYSLGQPTHQTFRLASYSPERFLETVKYNLDGLRRILDFNVEHGLGFLRISSEIIPFASHPVMTVDWLKHFKDDLEVIGKIILDQRMRISMHPDQFVLINSPKKDVVSASINDLFWHTAFLDAMKLGTDAKVQIHVGGVYGDKQSAMQRFVDTYQTFPKNIRQRLVIEHDDKLFSLQDCMWIHGEVGIPIVFDNLHHECLHHGESLDEAMRMAAKTWAKQDGILMMDYSSQQPKAVKGKHADTVDMVHARAFFHSVKNRDFDMMLEIRDKEKSALKILQLAKECSSG